MTLLLIEGFDQFQDAADFQPIYPRETTFSLIDVDARDSLGRAADINNNSQNILLPLAGIDEDTTITIGFAHYFGATDANHDLLDIYGMGGQYMALRYESTGELAVDRGTTEIAVSSGLGMVNSTWYYIEFQFRIHDTLGSYEVRVDGVAVIGPTTSVDTRWSSSWTVETTCIMVRGSSALVDNQFDDLYILDDNGLVNNDFLGDTQVETVFPTSDGFHSDFTPQSGLTNYEMVDDGNTPDNGTTYNASGTLNHRDTFNMGDLQAPTINTIHGVMPVFSAWCSEPGPREMRPVIRQNSTDFEGGADSLSPEYKHYRKLWETDPDTGSAWDEAGVNSAEFGYTIES